MTSTWGYQINRELSADDREKTSLILWGKLGQGNLQILFGIRTGKMSERLSWWVLICFEFFKHFLCMSVLVKVDVYLYFPGEPSRWRVCQPCWITTTLDYRSRRKALWALEPRGMASTQPFKSTSVSLRSPLLTHTSR